MAENSLDIDDLIRELNGIQEFQDEALLREALAEPIPGEERLHQVEQVLETLKGLGLFGRDDKRDLHLLLTLGRTYFRVSHLEKAHKIYQAALDLAGRLDDKPKIAELLFGLGLVCKHWNRWDKALDYLDRSLRAWQKLGDADWQARVILSRGNISHQRGDYEAATRAYEESLAIANRLKFRGLSPVSPITWLFWPPSRGTSRKQSNGIRIVSVCIRMRATT